MKKWIALLLFLPAVALGETFSLKDLSGGVYTNPSANRIPDNAATALENVFTDVENLAIERNGSEKRDTTVLGGTKAVTGLWEYVDSNGNQWIISFSSRTFYKNTVGGTPTSFGQLQTVNTVPDCAVNLGKFWCVDGTDQMWWFDGTSTAAVASAPIGTLIEPWRNRLIIGNINGAQSTLRVSGDGDGTSWTIGGNATDPFSIQIGGANDGFPTTCMWKSYLDNFVVGRKKDVWYLSGFSQADWELRNVSSEIGCIAQGSMREFDGSLLFLSNRGMEEARGYTITHISEPIRNITDSIVKNTASDRSNTQTSQADWQAGTITSGNLSTTISAGSLMASSFTATATSQADFNTGTNTNTETLSAGSVQISSNNFGGFEEWQINGISVNPVSSAHWSAADIVAGTHGWQEFGNGAGGLNGTTCGAMTARTGNSLAAYFKSTKPYTVTVKVKDQYTSTVYASSAIAYSDGACSWSKQTITLTGGDIGRRVVLVLDDTSVSDAMTSTVFTVTETTINFYTKSDVIGGTTRRLLFDDFTGFSESTGTYTSRTYNMGISTSYISVSTLGETVQANNGINISLQDSSNGTTWRTLGDAVTSTSTFVSRQYVRYLATFTVVGALSGGQSTLDNITLTAIGTGTYTSQVMDAGTSISSWRPVTINDVQTAGTISYQFQSSTNSNLSLFLSSGWNPITSGAVPTVNPQRYFAFRATFTATVATATLSLDSFQTSWTEGGTSQPISSFIYDRRYWLAYTTSTASGAYNDRVLVYQRNRTWTILTGINAAAFAIWRDAFYFGNSIGNGYVYKYDVGSSDDGTAISSVIQTKSYDLGVFNRDKDLRNLYVNFLGGTSFTGTYSVTYDLDRSGSAYSLGSANMNEGNGQVSAKFPFPLSNPVQGREIQYRITKSGTGDRLKLYELGTVFSVMEER